MAQNTTTQQLFAMMAAMKIAPPKPAAPAHIKPLQSLQVQSLTCVCGKPANSSVPNYCFCSAICRNIVYNNVSGAGIIIKHRYLGGEICDIVGRDRVRAHQTNNKHGLEMAGGGKKHGVNENPIDIATREFIEEFGLNVGEHKLKAYLSAAPMHVKKFTTKSGRLSHYVTFIVHITSVSTSAMETAGASRYNKYLKGLISYDCAEMDKFYHIRYGSGRFWKDHKTNLPVKICDRDKSIMNDCGKYYQWVVNMTPLNSLGIWDTSAGYLH